MTFDCQGGKIEAMIRDQIINALEEVSGQKNIQLEFPERGEFGDYSTNVALQTKDKNPRKTAQEIVEKFQKDKKLLEIVEKIEIAGPGFINFYLRKDFLLKNLSGIGESYGKIKTDPARKVIVEHSSPNIAKPFTIGHLRSTIIGDALANILEYSGWTVYRDNHLGDWGTQFGKQIYAIKTWGNEAEIEKSAEPIKKLVELYVKFHEEAEKNPELEAEGRKWFKKLEDGDPEARELWQKCVAWSLKEFSELYKRLGIKFTENRGVGYGESFFEDKMKPIIAELEEKHLLKESQGAKLIFFPKDKYPPLMIIKSDGATLYATRDLATDKFRLNHYGKDVVVINEVGIEQSLYWQQIFEAESLLGWYKKGQRIHVGHGHFRFKEGKMSTRKGNVIWMEDVLKEAVERAKKLGSETNDLADKVAIGAIKWNDLKRDPKQDIIFDWDEVLNMQGNSGPYLQYTFARTQSVITKAGGVKSGKENQDLNKEELNILRTLIKFPEIVAQAAETYSPNIICNYLYDLAQKFNTFYNADKIIGSDNEALRLKLTKAVGVVLKNGLKLLGIEAPERM